MPMMVKHGVTTADEIGIDTLKERIIAEAIGAAGEDALDWVGMSNTWISAWTRKQ